MIVTIMQPAYLPWLGYFDRIRRANALIVLDNVAIDRNSKTKFANRNRIRTPQGAIWLTVPILTRGRSDSLAINRLEIDPTQHWRPRHWASLDLNYRRAPHFAEHAPFFERLYATEWQRLAELCRHVTDYLLGALGLTRFVRYASEMNVEGSKDALILSLCRAAGATRYISGPLGRDYLDAGAFAAAGIELEFHDYRHPTYAQAFAGFEPYMSAVDLLFNHGPRSLAILSEAAPAPSLHA
jgi:hypothetical protein